MSSKDQQNSDLRPDNLRHNDVSGDQWDACPSGVLTHMVSRLDASQRHASRKQVFRTALISTAVFACIVLSIGSIVGSQGTQYGGINCAFCRGHLAEYYPHAAGEVALEDAVFVSSMKTHLEECTLCHEKFVEMYPNLPENGTASTRSTNGSINGTVLGIAVRPAFVFSQQTFLY